MPAGPPVAPTEGNMASTELLASKVVILEEEPNIPAINALPSAVLLAVGITERGPIADRTLTTSFEEYKRTYGGFTLDSEVAIAIHGFFYQGGSFAWISRTCHFTDLTDPSTYIATKASVMLQTSGTADSPAVIEGTVPGPFNMTASPVPGNASYFIEVDGGGLPPAAMNWGPASDSPHAPGTFPIAPLAPGLTMGVTVYGSYGNQEQTVVSAGGETTSADVANMLNTQISGLKVEDLGTQLELKTDWEGTLAEFEITTPGTLMAPLLLSAGPFSGTGNVQNAFAVTAAEVEAIFEGFWGTVDVVIQPSGTINVQTAGAGATKSIQLVVPTDPINVATLGLDLLLHEGADATPEDTLFVEGKTPGAYANNITTRTENATSGEAEKFDFKILVDGAVKETFPNVTMDETSADWVETRVNHASYGSDLVVVTDQLLAYTPLLKRPANGTSANMTGGDDGLIGIADADYIGNSAGPTGLYCFDVVNGGRILIVPGVYTPTVHKAMIDYAEIWRNGSMFCVIDCPPQQTAQQVITYVEVTATLLEYSEFVAIYWPWIKVSNPQPSVFGNEDTISVAPSGWIAGKMAANDQKIGGIYESPAGVGEGWGVIRGMIGVEDDPSGGSIHEVEDERKRDLVYPKRINPITRLPGTPWHIDGGRTLKSTGNFPNVAERRGVIFIEQTLAVGLVIFKHRPNNADLRRQVRRVIVAFLTTQMNDGAFRSTNTATAFFVDASDQLNPVANEFAGILTVRIGLATNKPSEYIVLLVTQDTRALEQQLAA